MMFALHIVAAFVLHNAIEPDELRKHKTPVIATGTIRVSQAFLDGVNRNLANSANFFTPAEDAVPQEIYTAEVERIATRTGEDPQQIMKLLHRGLHDAGAKAFIVSDEPNEELVHRPGPSPDVRLAPMLGSLVLLLWIGMLIFQGEGVEVDLQRRRHPMWEWLLSHPVTPGAVFTAEILSPLAANPIYWGAPLFVGFVYGFQYGFGFGAFAAVVAGVPLAVATSCLGKALEIAVMLRVSPRSRGAVIGLMSWLGYAATMFLFLGLFVMPKLLVAASRFLVPLTILPWPYLRWFLGGSPDGAYRFTLGITTCVLVSAAMTACAVRFSVWGTEQGLAGNFAADRPVGNAMKLVRFGREPLYRKELLWFSRDRSAIVQTILLPITLASFQLFNLRYFLNHAQDAWNYLCGVAVLFGTYFLWVLGPKSLASEGSALWIAETWPRGLESLLKAKAWLWSMISYAVVALILLYAAILFPAHIGQIILVGVGWVIFGRSMAEKAVTLVTVQYASGEVEKIPRGRRWATQLGMLTFAIGILTQQWQIAMMGIVYSWITAAAIWQNFRAHLPFLYDPWSETLPPPPTLMHAMTAISILVEGGAVITGICMGLFGSENIAIAEALAYALCSAAVAFGTSTFLEGRGVALSAILQWHGSQSVEIAFQPANLWQKLSLRKNATPVDLMPALLAGVAGGLLLGAFAHGYLVVLHHIPAADEILRKSAEQAAKIFALKQSYFVMAVLFAPFAEEYLFRGLLYRALDREWGGWQAVVGSAAFFALYHDPLSWLPVGLLGATNALLFKKTGRLAPAVVLHMVYNAIVLS
jgi:membrane protease YdiL (CAAX protease family)